MKLITISAEAHDALLRASPTSKTHGSARTPKGDYLLQVDEETIALLDAKAATLGTDRSGAVIAACR
jgi:hypothetical protein